MAPPFGPTLFVNLMFFMEMTQLFKILNMLPSLKPVPSMTTLLSPSKEIALVVLTIMLFSL